MPALIQIALLGVLVIQFGVFLARYEHRSRQALLLLAGTKLHVREAKEEHWAVLNAIHWLLIAQAKADGKIPREEMERLRDTPEQFGKHGRWSYQMPGDYFELNWQDEEFFGAGSRFSASDS